MTDERAHQMVEGEKAVEEERRAGRQADALPTTVDWREAQPCRRRAAGHRKALCRRALRAPAAGS